MRESSIWKNVMLAVHRVQGVRIFRNNVGQGWVGKSRRLRPGEKYTARGGEIIIQDPRPLTAGLFKGSADGIGWRTVVITPDMVGREIAQFLSVETKTATGATRAEQETWRQQVHMSGGLAVIVRSDAEAVEALNQIVLPFSEKQQ